MKNGIDPSEVTSQVTNGNMPLSAALVDHALMLWKMRWFFAIALVMWVLVAMGTTALMFCMTRNPISLSLFSTLAPPIYLWYRFVKYLLPMDERTFELKKLRIQARSESKKSFIKKVTQID